MAANSGNKKKLQTIDPVYQKFSRSVVRALGSSEFYSFFMDAMAGAENQIQFSNRRLEKTVDVTWVDAIENALESFQTILSAPRHIIREEEIVVNVAQAKRGGADVVQHLAQHAAFVDKFDSRTNEIQPNRLMQKDRFDAHDQYENKLVYTALDLAYTFVKIRHDALMSAMGDEFGAKLRVETNMSTATEAVHLDMFMHIKETESALDTDARHGDVFERISRIYRVLCMYMGSGFVQELAKAGKIKGTVIKTNVLKKNPDYRKVVQMYEFLRSYEDVGYTIRVVEQNPQISETFQSDIYHNVLFNYLVLKGYLEDERDRALPQPMKEKQRSLKPKFIKQIIEELTEDYDLPDVEIRKVLIEELTKEQLMHEEAMERRRLVEEQQQRKKEEQARLRKEREEEKARLRKAREAEKERIRQEKVAEQARLRDEQMRREHEDRRRTGLWKKDMALLKKHLEEQKQAREKHFAQQLAQQQDYADAAQLLEQAEQRRQAAQMRKLQRQQEEKERQQREKLLAERKKREQEQARQEELAKQEEQRLLQRANAAASAYREELAQFAKLLPRQKNLREYQQQQQRDLQQRWEEEARQRRALRAGQLNN
jgi:hypothetical protein